MIGPAFIEFGKDLSSAFGSLRLSGETLSDSEKFNELRQLHLIDMVNDRLRLTREGENARARGFFRVILNHRFQAEMKAFSSTKLKKHKKIFLCCFALCCSLWFLLILFHLGKVPLGIFM